MKSFLLLSIFLMAAYTIKKPVPPADEKDFLLSQFQETKNNLLKNVEGLSEAQLKFKPAPDRWSVGECVEHIVVSEKALFQYQQDAVKQPPNPDKRSEIKITDQDLIKNMVDRSRKAKAQESGIPKGIYATSAEAVQAFNAQRDKLVDYVKSTSDDLRNHVMERTPMGAMDTYQFLLLISAHTARHTKQIEEVKADPGFPK
jgi:hypothetical protein